MLLFFLYVLKLFSLYVNCCFCCFCSSPCTLLYCTGPTFACLDPSLVNVFHSLRLYIPSRDRDVAKQLREELESRLAVSENDQDMDGTDTSVGNRP